MKTDKYIKIFRKNFPYIKRENNTVKNIIENKDNIVLEEKNILGKTIGLSIINKNTILLFCVDKNCRNKGIGTKLLEKSEKIIKNNGYNEIIVGAGFDYLMPGVPTSKRYFNSENESLYSFLDNNASNFFEKREYKHSWDCNCFDMLLNLSDLNTKGFNVGDTIDGINYRWATIDDLDKVVECVYDAHSSFAQYYKDKTKYTDSNSRERVLVAAVNDEIVGAIIVNRETEGKGYGSVGCTAVKHSYRGKHIAVNMVIISTKYLKTIGLTSAGLGYTYTGLDHMYGYAGYKICCYYMMAKKKI